MPPESATTAPAPAASPNFAFLAKHDPALVRIAGQAERYCFDDPNTSLIKARQLCELIARHAAARVGIKTTAEESQVDVLRALRDRGGLPRETADLFHTIRRVGNAAVHDHGGTRSDALSVLKYARQAAIWFHRSFGGAKEFKPGAFVPPPNPGDADRQLQATLEELREKLAEQSQQAESAKAEASTHAATRAEAEARAAKAYADLEAALELAQETEQQLASERIRLEALLTAESEAAKSAPVAVEAVVQAAQAAAASIDLDEADTRRLIDAQLREAGWEVNSETLRWGRGVRPQKERSLAIAEVPTASGPADYVLYSGLTPLAAVEAKRRNIDPNQTINQAALASV